MSFRVSKLMLQEFVQKARHDKYNNTNGFKDDTATDPLEQSDDYHYDANGNMTYDENKGIVEILYNHLNLPTQITFDIGIIKYLYDATGKKLRKIVHTDNNTPDVITEYLDGFQYKDGVIQFFPTAEGYANRLNNTYENGDFFPIDENEPDTFSYIYNYTDHLGNIRLSYTKEKGTNVLKIVEENHYYPFGLKHNNYNSDRMIYAKEGQDEKFKPLPPYMAMSYNYKYNGKELQDELGLNMYDYGSRLYDPARAGWSNIDPLAEKFPSWSPYTFCYNNPMRYTDPTGMAPDDLILKFHGDNSKAKTQAVLDQGLGKGVAKIDDNGKVTLNGKCEDLKTEAQRGLFDVLSKPINSEKDTTIDVFDNDKSIFSGDYKGGRIDIGDINNFGTGELDNKFTVLGHEINEQFEYQTGNKLPYNDPNSSHMNSIKIESTINGGWLRGKSTTENGSRYQLDVPNYSSPGTRKVWSGSAIFHTPFTKGNETRIFTYEVKDFNVVPLR